MKTLLIFFPLLMLLYHIASAQLAPKKYMVGVNLTSWAFTGLPEIRLNYNIRNDGNLYTGIAVRGGLSNKKPMHTGNDIRFVERRGGWLMAGLYGRYFFHKKGVPAPWVALMYVRSYSLEKAYLAHGMTASYKTIYAAVNGVVLTSGVDCKIWKGFSGQVGLQLGYHGKREYFDIEVTPFQPGIGSSIVENVTILPVIGLGYHFGKIK